MNATPLRERIARVHEAGGKIGDHRHDIDAMTAAILLQGVLDRGPVDARLDSVWNGVTMARRTRRTDPYSHVGARLPARCIAVVLFLPSRKNVATPTRIVIPQGATLAARGGHSRARWRDQVGARCSASWHPCLGSGGATPVAGAIHRTARGTVRACSRTTDGRARAVPATDHSGRMVHSADRETDAGLARHAS